MLSVPCMLGRDILEAEESFANLSFSISSHVLGTKGKVYWVSEGGLEVRVSDSQPLVWNNLVLQKEMLLLLSWRIDKVEGVILESAAL
jgi:hypothetical protein